MMMKLNLKPITRGLFFLAVIATGILSVLSCSPQERNKDNSENALVVWKVDPLDEIQQDALPKDALWGYSVIACQGEYESAQIAIRTEDKKLTVHIEATDLLQTLGPGHFDMKNLQLRLIDYSSGEVRETPVSLPGSFVLKQNQTQALRLTVYVPRGTEPTGYHQGVIKLRTDKEEVDVGMLIRVRDIEIPESFSSEIKKLAERYGLEKLADILDSIYDRDQENGEAVSSVYWEKLHDGIEDLQLLWLLEQAQTVAAQQQGKDVRNIDLTARGRKICSQINSNLIDQEVDISTLREVRNEFILAIQRAKIQPVDTGNSLTVNASVAPTTPADFAYGTEGRFCFQFQIKWTPIGKVKAGDYLRFAFRDLFTNKITYYNYPEKNPIPAETKILLTAKDIDLKPSSYHVRVDLMRGDQSLSPNSPGACQIYVTHEGESPKHMYVSFVSSRLAYMWDEKQGIFYHMLPGNLPSTGDPFDPTARPVYEQALRLEINRMGYYDWTGRSPMENVVPEAQHDGGAGILHCAGAFRVMGETDRALFCEQAVKRIVEAVLARKVDTVANGQPGLLFYAPRQQQTLLLKLLSDVYFYFHDVVGDKNYAQKLYEPIMSLGNYQMNQPNPLGVSEGKVYDGRVLVGLSNYCLTENKINGQFNQDHVETVFDFATRMSEHTLLHQGWYDEGGKRSHHGYSTMNLLWGLLEARKVALIIDDNDHAKLFGKAILTAFDFLARTNSYITGFTPQWIPSRHGAWSAGDTYEMLNEIEHQFGENKTVQWYRAHLFDRNIDYFARLISKYVETSSLGSRNALPGFLLECEEYKEIAGAGLK